MKRALPKLFGRLRWARKPKAASRPVRPAILALEDRLVPAAPTEMADLARLFPRHSGPTALYVNFDGWTAQGVAPFMSVSGGDRDRDIQDILFRTAEVFAPFDVQVIRRFGNSNYDTINGLTTIFVGDDSDNGTGTANRSRGFTSSGQVDFPGDWRGVTHRPNSDSYNLAFIDPVEFSPMPTPNGNLRSWTALQISRAIAHEAGHTFGLGHVRTDGQTDPAPLNSQLVADMMSYPTAAGEIFFADQSFPLTEANFTADGLVMTDDVVPKWHVVVPFGTGQLIVPYRMQTQNSFAYLQAALGPRVADDFPNVAHSQTVAYFTETAPAVARGSLLNGTIHRYGDYDVFQFTPGVTQTLNVSTLRAPGGAVFNTTVLVYQGESLVAFNDNRTATDRYSQATHTFVAGLPYRIVVGSYGGRSAGAYRLWVSAPGDPHPDDRTGPSVIATKVQYTPLGAPTGILVTFSEEVDPATFSSADVALVSATGVVKRPSSITPTGLPNRQFLLKFGVMPKGDHTLTIGPNVNDFAGNPMTDVYTELVDLDPLGLDDPIGP